MAEKTTLTDEQVARIGDLLGELDRDPSESFFPLKENFEQDMASLGDTGDTGETESGGVPMVESQPEPPPEESLGEPGETTPLDFGLPLSTGEFEELATPETAVPEGFAEETEPEGLTQFGETTGPGPEGSEPLLEPETPTGGDFGELADLGDLGGTDISSLHDFLEPGETEGPSPAEGRTETGGLDDLGLEPFPGGLESEAEPSPEAGGFGEIPGEAPPDAAGTPLTFDENLDLGEISGADFGTDLGADLGVGPGADLGGDLGTDLGTDLGAGLGADLGEGSEFAPGGMGEIPEDVPIPDLSPDQGLEHEFPAPGGEPSGAGEELDFGALPSGEEHGGFDFGGEHHDLGGEHLDLGEDLGLSSDMGSIPDLSAHEGAPFAGEAEFGAGLDLGTEELADMSKQALMGHGIGDEFTDEELAKLRSRLMEYSPGIRKTVIDAIVNEKIPQTDQRLLTHMIIDQATDDAVASFLESRLGYRPDTTAPDRTREGVPILYTEDVTPEALQRRRKRAIYTLAGVGGVLITALAVFGGLQLWHHFSVTGKYERGLAALREAEKSTGEERQKLKQEAEAAYQDALRSAGGNYSIEYMTKFGIAYMKAGFYDDAFTRLFGKVDPPYDWTGSDMRAPLVRLAEGGRWFGVEDQAKNYHTKFLAADNRVREIIDPGAYLVSRLRDGKMDRENLLALGRFHSGIAYDFVHSDEGKKYKNDMLAIDYYRLILTLLDRPQDVEAMAGVGRVYYERGEYGTAVREYNRILEHNPAEIRGHAGLLETYIEIWRQNGDPRFVIEKHRQIQRLGQEKKIPIFIMTKLAGFYIDINSEDLRIKYQVDPIDNFSGLEIEDNARKLLDFVFESKEDRDGETVRGSTYAEGYFQRGRFLKTRREAMRSVKQFQNAYQYNPRHYPSLNEIGEYYGDILDFDRAKEYFLKAIETREQYYRTYGTHPEDETLAHYDTGRIYFNLASLVFKRYAGIQKSDLPKTTRIYPESDLNDEAPDVEERRQRLYEASQYLKKALDEGLREKKSRRSALFWLGWIPYIQGDFGEAITRWSDLELEDEDGAAPMILSFGKANAAFHTHQYRTALGYYLKLREDLERIVPPESVGRIPADEKMTQTHYMLYSVYNNLGAVYEAEYREKRERGTASRELERLQTKGLSEYMNAIELARRVGFIPEKATINREFAFKETVDRTPLIEDWLNPIPEE